MLRETLTDREKAAIAENGVKLMRVGWWTTGLAWLGILLSTSDAWFALGVAGLVLCTFFVIAIISNILLVKDMREGEDPLNDGVLPQDEVAAKPKYTYNELGDDQVKPVGAVVGVYRGLQIHEQLEMTKSDGTVVILRFDDFFYPGQEQQLLDREGGWLLYKAAAIYVRT
jgi:hypothetical protein